MMYVWRQFSQVDFKVNLAATFQGLHAWFGVADKLIATCGVGSVEPVKRWLETYCPMPFILGIKTSGIPYGFVSKSFWEAVAAARVLACHPYNAPFLLDNETKLKAWHRTGDPPIILEELAENLSAYRAARYWIYCADVLKNLRGDSSWSLNREALTYDLADTLHRAAPDVKFVTGYARTRAVWHNDDERRRRSRMLEAIGGMQNEIPSCNVQTADSTVWTPKQFVEEAMPVFGGIDFIVWPGVANFEACGVAMRRALGK